MPTAYSEKGNVDFDKWPTYKYRNGKINMNNHQAKDYATSHANQPDTLIFCYGDKGYGQGAVHYGYVNVNCFDGHVESVKAKEYTSNGLQRLGIPDSFKEYQKFWL